MRAFITSDWRIKAYGSRSRCASCFAIQRPNDSFLGYIVVDNLLVKSVIQNLKAFVLSENPYQARAIDLVFRILPAEEAREWINVLAKNPQQIRQVIRASATFSDSHVINWLITQMCVPALMRLAVEAFTTITGIGLEEHKLALEELPQLENQLPSAAANDDLTDGDVHLSDDDRLPFPSADKIAAVWQKYQQRFIPGRRYFMGQQISSEHLLTIYASGNQRQRWSSRY